MSTAKTTRSAAAKPASKRTSRAAAGRALESSMGGMAKAKDTRTQRLSKSAFNPGEMSLSKNSLRKLYVINVGTQLPPSEAARTRKFSPKSDLQYPFVEFRQGRQGQIKDLIIRDLNARSFDDIRTHLLQLLEQLPQGPSNQEVSPANAEIERTRETLARSRTLSQAAQAVAAPSIESLYQFWINQHLLTTSEDLADSWHRSRQALDSATNAGKLFRLKIKNRLWYPSVFKRLPAEAVGEVNQCLSGLEPVTRFLFWQEKIGSLRGQKVSDAIAKGNLQGALRAARAYVEEILPA